MALLMQIQRIKGIRNCLHNLSRGDFFPEYSMDNLSMRASQHRILLPLA